MMKLVDTLFCDDVRVEVQNKISIIGLFGTEMLVPHFPLVLGRFFIVFRFETGLKPKPLNGSIEITLPDGKKIAHTVAGPIQLTLAPGIPPSLVRVRKAKHQYHNVIIGLTGVPILKPGIIKVGGKFGRKQMLLGQLYVSHAPEFNSHSPVPRVGPRVRKGRKVSPRRH